MKYKEIKTFLFLTFILVLFTFSACQSKKAEVFTGKETTGEVTSDLNALSSAINETEQLDAELKSPDFDLDVNF